MNRTLNLKHRWVTRKTEGNVATVIYLSLIGCCTQKHIRSSIPPNVEEMQPSISTAPNNPSSTNDLLEKTYTPEIDESDADDVFRPASLEHIIKLKRAQRHALRAALYGCGARSKLPNVGRKKKESTLFSGLQPSKFVEKQKFFSDSIPPGAHSDQFRLVCNLTRKSQNDAESYLYTTTSMTKGIKYATGQPPWYCGYNNKTVPPDSSLVHGACRYGFRGSKGIKQYEAKPYQMPSFTVTEHTPKFLDCSCRINEWVPPILARTYQTVNGLESPKLWPENTEHPNGARLQKSPTSTRYNRETTVAISDKIGIPERLKDYITRAGNLDDTIQNFARMESYSTLLSTPMRARLNFESNWSTRIKECASTQLQATLNTCSLHGNFRSLVNSMDKITYAGKTAFIVNSQDFNELKYKMKLDKSYSILSLENQWNQVNLIFETIRGQIDKDLSFTEAIKIIITTLLNSVFGDGEISPPQIRMDRGTFMDLFCQIPFCTTMTSQKVSILFNSFDRLKRNHIDIIDLISTLIILNNPHDTTLQKLIQIWNLYDQMYGNELSPVDISLKVLQSSCSSDIKRKNIEIIFKDSFRPICYKMSLQAFIKSPSLNCSLHSIDCSDSRNNFTSDEYDICSSDVQIKRVVSDNLRRSMTSIGSIRSKTTAIDSNFHEIRESKSSAGSKLCQKNRGRTHESKVQGPMSAYSICEEFFTGPEKFIEILQHCPLLLSTFEEELEERLFECYGVIDGRLREEKKKI